MGTPIISIPWTDETMMVPDLNKVKVNGELAVDILAQRDRYREALAKIQVCADGFATCTVGHLGAIAEEALKP